MIVKILLGIARFIVALIGLIVFLTAVVYFITVKGHSAETTPIIDNDKIIKICGDGFPCFTIRIKK